MTDATGNTGVFRSRDINHTEAEESAEVRILRPARRWTPESFAREQTRGLVRQVFFSSALRPVRQVVFSPLEGETDVRNLCRRVGHALALETTSNVAVVGAYPRVSQHEVLGDSPLRQVATAVRSNLWLVPTPPGNDSISDSEWHAHLCELRTTFEYSIVEGPPAGESNNEVTAMAQLADGIILVLSARHTRRATAQKVKERFEAAQTRILGTVLSDRSFPIPDSIYRRL
jgi:hypothetical protein